MATYNYAVGAYEVTNDYVAGLELINGGRFRMDGGVPSPGGGDSGGGGSGGSGSSSYTMPDYGTNLWIAQVSLASGYLTGIVTNTQPDILYELQGCPDIATAGWISYGFFNGSELTNWAPASVLATTTNLFLRIRSWEDTTGTGIPDWWWFTYFGQATNVDANDSAAGDGFSNWQKFQMGVNPTNYFTMDAPGGFFGSLDASGTNAFLEWSNLPGPVVNYIIQRGIQDTNGNYSYSQIGMVSSNATFF